VCFWGFAELNLHTKYKPTWYECHFNGQKRGGMRCTKAVRMGTSEGRVKHPPPPIGPRWMRHRPYTTGAPHSPMTYRFFDSFRTYHGTGSVFCRFRFCRRRFKSQNHFEILMNWILVCLFLAVGQPAWASVYNPPPSSGPFGLLSTQVATSVNA
jgi:hypothetical protein